MALNRSPLERFSLDGRTAAVTGGASGLGQASAVALAGAGARIVVFDRDPMDETAAALGDRGLTIFADLADAEQVAAPATKALEWSDGQVDVLMNDADIASPLGRLHEVSSADFARVPTVNLRSMFLTMKTFQPALVAR